MKKAMVAVLVAVGALALFALVAAVGIGLFLSLGKKGVPGKTILEANLDGRMIEDVPDDPVARTLLADTPVVRDTVEAIDRGAGDRRVVGLLARIGASPIGMAQVQEIREAIASFRAKKKFAVAYAETFGEFAPGNSAYYLATAFDEIWLQPSGDLGLTGLMFESPFVRGTLEKLGMTPRMDHRWEYKNAMNTFTEKKYTPEHREAMEKVMNSWFSQMLAGMAQARHTTSGRIRSIAERGPLLGREAVEAGLADGVAYRDEVYEKVKRKAGPGAKFLYLAKYLARAGRPHSSGKAIALIFGVGGVSRGKSGYNPVFGEVTMGSDTVAGAFRAAVEDKKVRAILFRVDSPGGSYVASDTIWRETSRARKAGKPVVVSMGNLAGSGGYFVAMGADKIVAQPGTITGSIGVLGGKMLTSSFWDKLGISWDEVHTGANATMWTGTHDYTKAEWERFQAALDRIYDDFTSKVAEGRKLPKEKVLRIARGRIWTGEDAKGLGLVDELGGFSVALKLAKQAAGIREAEEVRLKVFPPKKRPLDIFFGEEPESSEPASAAALARLLELVQPAARQVRRLGGGRASTRGVLAMPELPVQVAP